jgi:hypothetical protein
MKNNTSQIKEVASRIEKMTQESFSEMDLQIYELALVHVYFGVKIYHSEVGDEATIEMVHRILKSVLEGEKLDDSISKNLKLFERNFHDVIILNNNKILN